MTLLQDIEIDDDHVGADEIRRSRRHSGYESERATRSRAAQRAIDRRRKRLERDERADQIAGRSKAKAMPVAGRPLSVRARIAGIPFVVPVLALLVVGLGLSLLLSTKAAADSYRLGEERQANQALLDRRDSLKRSYESGDSAPELSDKASRLGMIPAKNPARMVVNGTGRPRVIGDPEAAQGRAMRSINPPTGPDPVSSIDPKKVDDSEGLPGGTMSSTGTQQDSSTEPSSGSAAGATSNPAPAPTTAPGASSATTPDAAAPGPGAAAPPAPAVRPAPNVLPTNQNAPGANSPESR
ncbi:hypothetical protein GTV32_02205 [Gordonia sp. SID5947]|uniref:hypothetical protein n=1 Tax=Gordonia sp. SID5947 TaxID=2690315 RepID=UPI00136B17B7|nr:hypothetical protein [Gordonia sp. SID5947]MYR05211.1 hypothetical protein [Gordonia sp. SID5947]